MSFTQLGRNSNISTLADKVYLWDAAKGTYVQYYLRTDRTWWTVNPNTGPYNPTVALGQGFWYQAKAGFQWAETNKYLNNL